MVWQANYFPANLFINQVITVFIVCKGGSSLPPFFKIFVSPPFFSVPPPFKLFQTVPPTLTEPPPALFRDTNLPYTQLTGLNKYQKGDFTS